MMPYRFDKKLRLLLFNEIEKIEVPVRCAIVNFGTDLLDNMNRLFATFSEIDKAALGFPSSWENEPLWQ